jgi:hypothetical protein
LIPAALMAITALAYGLYHLRNQRKSQAGR